MPRSITALASAALITASALTIAGAQLSSASAAPAVTIHVSGTGDDTPGNPCTTIDTPCLTISGAVTRAQAAITDGAVDVAVSVAAGTYAENVVIGSVADGHSLSLVGASASETILEGLGTAGTPASVISITTGVVNISQLTVTGGVALNGGGVHNVAGTLSISDSTISSNQAIATGQLVGGGGLHNDTGIVTVTDSTVADNDGYQGGGIYNNTGGQLTVSGSTISGNTGTQYTGGIYSRGILTVSSSTLSDNHAAKNFGGGIANYAGTLTVTDSTLSGNTAIGANTGKGGAIYNRGPATVTNSTLVGNIAYQGGGISNRDSMTLTNSTLSNNTATDDAAFRNRGGGIYQEAGVGVTVSNSILSGSRCSIVSTLADGGHNVSDGTCGFYIPSPTSIVDSTTIGLSPLAANGSTGPHTMAIGTGSSAHHLIATCTGLDQRGLGRPGFGPTARCDAGAYEIQPVAAAVTASPQSQTLPIGSDATFTAAASGAPDPTVQWQVDEGSGFQNIAGATSTPITVSNVTHSMTGYRYRAVFTNGMGPSVNTDAATLTVPVGALDRLELSPSTTTLVAGGSRAFTATGYDAFDNQLGDLTEGTTFSASSGMTCEAAACTAKETGTYTVTGTNGDATGTATVTVTTAALDHLVLSPATSTIAADGVRTFSARGFDSFGNRLGDVTRGTVFTATGDMTCKAATCTPPRRATKARTYTVTGTNGSATGTARVTVKAAPVKVKRQKAVVVRVIDGDTVKVRLLPRGPKRKVQLIGINAPELRSAKKCWGSQSKKALARLLPAGKRIRLVSDPTQRLQDSNHRLRRYVMKSSRDINRTMVARGHARVQVSKQRPFKRVKKYRASSASAKRHDKGLWGNC